MAEIVISKMDIRHLEIIRDNVREFMRYASTKYALASGRLLDIAPQIHEGARPFFPETVSVETLDIDPDSGCTYIGDICRHNDFLLNDMFDYVVCTEVLEHTLQPFNAVDEIWRILKPGGLIFCSTPYNFRIHGPLPDCWRFSEHGLRALFNNFLILEIRTVETKDRALMPIHYTLVARKPIEPKEQEA